jgi:hypothetical protein
VKFEIEPKITVPSLFGQLPCETQKTLGNEGWLFIRSQARLDQVLEQFHAVEKPVRLPPVDFDMETAGETDGMAARKPDGGKYQMWGGNLAANTVTIRVGDAGEAQGQGQGQISIQP